MKHLWKKYCETGLVKRIIIGLIIGTILALLRPSLGEGSAGNVMDSIKLFGKLFTGALKAMAPVLVFFLVMEALSKHEAGHKTNMKHVILLYLVANFMAAVCAGIASFIFPVTLTLPPSTQEIKPPQGLDEVLISLLMNLVDNPVNALITPNYIGILFWSVLIGLALKVAAPSTKLFISNMADAISEVVKMIINFAPIGIMGLIYDSITTSGVGIFKEYGLIILLLVLTMAVVALIVNPLIVFTQIKQNPYPLLFTTLRRSGITAFFTRSSAANIPVNMQLCKDLGLDEDTYSVSIPLGATINMGGCGYYYFYYGTCSC